MGVVGESGCGKSVTALSIMNLIPRPPGKIVGGSIRFQNRELVGLPECQLTLAQAVTYLACAPKSKTAVRCQRRWISW
jgi:ABC-type dipeptide/oligopeptide/nickel transport system ATPase component